MKSMGRKELGNEPEILALQDMLNVNIHVQRARELGNNPDKPCTFDPSKDKIDIPLLYRPGHYDLLIQKNGPLAEQV